MSPDDRAPTWFVLVEQDVGGGQSRSRTVTDVLPATNYDHARQLAREVAFTFRPNHPMNPRRRSVYQAGDDTWIVLVEGATSTFHFRTIVAQWLGDAP